ncbi:fasciclin domain-containing protein [Longitalea arenae]|uniref:fasciclin domain-containing protein n=1 Tax=Longitalea arenae TaxID=2812558 RepID=UPI00196728D3|nr:fasciclin domain-containing protein [Longitalea arenae]
MKTKLTALLITILAALCAGSCKKHDLRLTTTDDVNISSYLAKYPDSFSLWSGILQRTEISNFLDMYGSYTVFAPTNSGVQAWLNANNIVDVGSADVDLLKDIVKFHILEDTLTTPSFKDGKLPVPTMHGQFIITGATNEGGVSRYRINRQALVTASNIRLGNGYVHVINQVLEPARQTVAQQLAANPDYSIFVEALKETGFYRVLDSIYSDSSRRWKTVLAETNQALADSGIHSYAALKAKYSNTHPADPSDSLNLYIAYHIIPGIQFLGDIINAPSYLTMQPQEVISTKLINNEVVINEDEFNGVVEKGVLLLRNKSDNAATNGVWHTAHAHFAAKLRKPTAVYWDLATFPEIMKQPAYYGKQGFTFNKSSQEDRPIRDIDWHYNGENYVSYIYNTTHSFTNYACKTDALQIPLGAPSNNNRAQWVEFSTPPIIKGRYKVWICYRNRNSVTINVRVNGELMQRPINVGQGYPGGNDTELESLGWKKYTLGGSFAGRLAGTVELRTTERHKLRFEAVSGSNREIIFDMVHFIPVDQVQYLPRFAPDGSMVWQ